MTAPTKTQIQLGEQTSHTAGRYRITIRNQGNGHIDNYYVEVSHNGGPATVICPNLCHGYRTEEAARHYARSVYMAAAENPGAYEEQLLELLNADARRVLAVTEQIINDAAGDLNLEMLRLELQSIAMIGYPTARNKVRAAAIRQLIADLEAATPVELTAADMNVTADRADHFAQKAADAELAHMLAENLGTKTERARILAECEMAWEQRNAEPECTVEMNRPAASPAARSYGHPGPTTRRRRLRATTASRRTSPTGDTL